MSLTWHRILRFGLVPNLTMAVLLPLFLYMGIWQLQRAEEKSVLQSEYDSRASGPVLKVEPHVQRPEELQFYRVVAKGYFETDYQILIDNRVHQGRAGFHVITPLRLQDSEVRLLVNRGWIPLGDDRNQLPIINTPKGLQEVAGVATVPSVEIFLLNEPESLEHGWQIVWQNMDLKRFQSAVPFPVQPVVVLLDPNNRVSDLIRDWSRLDAGIAVHQGYAFQWFLLSSVLIAIYLLLALRRSGPDNREEKDS